MGEVMSDEVDTDIPYEYYELGYLMDTYLDEIRPVLEKGKFDFIPLLNFKAALGNYMPVCRSLGPQVQSAHSIMLSHLERALSKSK